MPPDSGQRDATHLANRGVVFSDSGRAVVPIDLDGLATALVVVRDRFPTEPLELYPTSGARTLR